MNRGMPLRAGILTLALLLLAAAPARAAFDVTAFELTPSSTAAGAHADVTIATSFTPNQQPRTGLPPAAGPRGRSVRHAALLGGGLPRRQLGAAAVGRVRRDDPHRP